MGILRDEAMRFFNMAYEFQMQGHLEQAIAYYKKSLEAEPTAEAHTFLGWVYSMQGRLEEAIAECHRAISLDPDYGNPYNDIGVYLMQSGKLDEAMPWFKRAMEVLRYENPEFPHANLAIVYEMKGLWPLALEEYERALALRPDYKVALIGVMRLRANLN
ncbi:MAG: tetratricopeptide repeat protein [candidate division KSB1 bacterium]|nr:tetratricopeptide repeat protein [candidate division KSB1 bacterium]